MSTNIIIDEPFGENDQLETELGEVIDSKTKETSEYEIPEKFADKSKEEIAQSYAELEKRLGNQGQELGDLRKVADNYLRQQLDTNDTKTEVDEVDFYDDPKKAVNQVIESNPAIQRVQELENQLKYSTFTNKHPNFKDTAGSEEFQKWVQSSNVRTRMYKNADNLDFDEANDLFDLWDERQDMVKEAVSREKVLKEEEKERALKDATGESGSTGNTSRKMYRRADLINLRATNPDKYSAMQDEILAAYAEGRVK